MSGIIIVFPKPEDGQAFKSLLIRNGYENISVTTTGAMAINMADNLGEGIIISGYRLPDMLFSGIYEEVQEHFEMLVIASADKLIDLDISVAKLEMPLKVRDFLNSIEMMTQNLECRHTKERRKPPQRSPEEKATIEQAKKVLMEKNNLTENEAHRYIQKSAMNSGNTMVETATMILTVMYRD